MIFGSKEAEKHFNRGINYFRSGFFSSAAREFRAVKKITPDYQNIDYILEACDKKNSELSGKLTNFISENFDEEIQSLSEELIVEGSSNLAAQVEVLIKKGQTTSALEKISNARNVLPDSKPLLLLAANVQRRLGMISDAKKTLEEAILHYSDDTSVLNCLANVYADIGLYTEAENMLQRALVKEPDNAAILNNIGSLKMNTNRLDEAGRFFRKSLKKSPGWSVPDNNLKILQTRIDILEQEIEQLREEFAKHPNYPDIGFHLGKSLFLRGFFSESGSVLRNVLKKKPSLLSALFYLGALSEINEDYQKAAGYYEKMVLKTQKDNTPEYSNFKSLLEQGFEEEAIEEIKKIAILELDPANARIRLGIKYFEDCLWQEALKNFSLAAEINDTYPDAYYWMGLTQVYLGQPDQAKKCFEKAIELNPDYSDAHYQIGLLMVTIAPEKAKLHFNKALSGKLKPAYQKIANDTLNKI